jgi:hypothetical protein
LRLIGGTLAAASPASAQNACVEDTDTLDHAGENAQTLFSGMSPQDNEGIIAPNPPPPRASLPALSDFWPSSECLADRSRYFFARRWRRWRALNLLAGRFCPSGLGCHPHRSRYFFARRCRQRRTRNLLAGRFSPSVLGCCLVYQSMRAFFRAAISEEHANCVGEIIIWCHC